MEYRIYMDNASTSFPKAPGVSEAICHFLNDVGCNVGRGSYQEAYSAAETVIHTRERLSKLFCGAKGKYVLFTANVTQSLNMLLKGFLQPGDHVLISSMEHNAVMRPLAQLSQKGITYSQIPCDETGALQLDGVEPLILPHTRAIVTLHASNVCGTVMPLKELGVIARSRGLRLIVDAAQTAGVLPIDMQDMQIDALAFTGHKGLLGPQGIGGFVLSEQIAREIEPLLSGGTGSMSDSQEMPGFLPDRFEAGTLNLPGIYGLNAALQYLENTGIDAIRNTELALANRLARALRQIPGVKLLGIDDWSRRVAIVAADFSGYDNAQISYELSEEYGVLTRCGLHCSPAAHKNIGSFPHGCIRFSLSHFNTQREVDYCADAVTQILSHMHM